MPEEVSRESLRAFGEREVTYGVLKNSITMILLLKLTTPLDSLFKYKMAQKGLEKQFNQD